MLYNVISCCTMSYHVIPWLYHDYTMVVPCFTILFHVIPWSYHGYTRVFTMLYRVLSCFAMVIPWLYHAIPCYFMFYHGYTMLDHVLSCYTMSLSCHWKKKHVTTHDPEKTEHGWKSPVKNHPSRMDIHAAVPEENLNAVSHGMQQSYTMLYHGNTVVIPYYTMLYHDYTML